MAAVDTDGGGDRPATDGDAHIPDAMTQRLEALAKRLAIEQKVSDIYLLASFLASGCRGIAALPLLCSSLSSGTWKANFSFCLFHLHFAS